MLIRTAKNQHQQYGESYISWAPFPARICGRNLAIRANLDSGFLRLFREMMWLCYRKSWIVELCGDIVIRFKHSDDRTKRIALIENILTGAHLANISIQK